MAAEAITAPAPVLRSRPLAALLAAEVLSTTGSQMTWLALPWFVLVTTIANGLVNPTLHAFLTLRPPAAVRRP
jgi:hypothetical protein